MKELKKVILHERKRDGMTGIDKHSSYKLLNYEFKEYMTKCEARELTDIITVIAESNPVLEWDTHPTEIYAKLLCNRLKDTETYQKMVKISNMERRLGATSGNTSNSNRLTMIRSAHVPGDVNVIDTIEGEVEYVITNYFISDLIDMINCKSDEYDEEEDWVCERVISTLYHTFLDIIGRQTLDGVTLEDVRARLAEFDFNDSIANIYSVLFIYECLQNTHYMETLISIMDRKFLPSLHKVAKKDAFSPLVA